jgi:hypothetical protein
VTSTNPTSAWVSCNSWSPFFSSMSALLGLVVVRATSVTGAGRPPVRLQSGVAQLVARRAHNPEVGGSNPPPASNTTPQATKAEGAGVLRRMGASARRSGAREYRPSYRNPLAMDAGAEKCPATLRNPACVRPVHGMANKVEALGLAARRRGLSIHSGSGRMYGLVSGKSLSSSSGGTSVSPLSTPSRSLQSMRHRSHSERNDRSESVTNGLC